MCPGLRLSRSTAARPHDGGSHTRSYAPSTVKTYAVKWREPDGQTFVGRLALGPLTLNLDGRRHGADEPAVNRELGYEGLIGSSGAGRLDGRPACKLERTEGTYLVAGAGQGAPILQELVERLAELAGPQKPCG